MEDNKNLENIESTTEGQESEKSYKTFATEEEFANTIKSERSKAQNALIQELGVKSIKEAKERLESASTLDAKVAELSSKYENLEKEALVKEYGIKEEYREEALLLAQSKVNENTDLKKALSLVVEKIPAMVNPKNSLKQVGAEKGEDGKDSQVISDSLMKRYPWLKK